MQNTQFSLESSVKVTKALKNNLKLLSRSSIRKNFIETSKSRGGGNFSQKNFFPVRPQQTVQNQTSSFGKDYTKAVNYLSSIEDPLWKHVCRDVIHMMGAESFLKIWNSTLGELCPQDQSMEIRCQTEEIAQFIQKYDFVILGSLQPYFPSLKQLKAKHISTL